MSTQHCNLVLFFSGMKTKHALTKQRLKVATDKRNIILYYDNYISYQWNFFSYHFKLLCITSIVRC